MVANLLTASRIALLAPLAVLLSSEAPALRWAALGLFALAGLTDVLDGRIARALGQASRLGALLDLVADRLLSLTLVLVLSAAGELRGAFAVAGWALVARDLVVASLAEAAGERVKEATRVEHVKIALQTAGFALLIAPEFLTAGLPAPGGFGTHRIGAWLLVASAVLAAGTAGAYAQRTRRNLGRGGQPGAAPLQSNRKNAKLRVE
jgi:phosphatidylglycerophosphate synthase